MSDPRRLSPEGTESRALAEVLALAFRDNPLNRAVIEGSEARRLRANRAGMRASLSAAVPSAVVLVAPDETGDHPPVVGREARLALVQDCVRMLGEETRIHTIEALHARANTVHHWSPHT